MPASILAMVSKSALGRLGACSWSSSWCRGRPASHRRGSHRQGPRRSARPLRTRQDPDQPGPQGLRWQRHPDGKEDLDHDGLTNRQEYIVGTHPRRADTDHDGKRDDRENADGDTLWNRTEFRAGTSPLRKDTDGDGLGDGKEDPDRDRLTNRQEQDHGTHPRKADTDGDGIAMTPR